MLGHRVTGGGATVNNSPVNLHIHIHTNDATAGQKIARALHGLFGGRQKTIEGVRGFSEDNIQRVVSGEFEDR